MMGPPSFATPTALVHRRSAFVSTTTTQRPPLALKRWRPALMTLSAPVDAAASSSTILRRWYRPVPAGRAAVAAAARIFGEKITISEEASFIVALSRDLSASEEHILAWLFAETYEPALLRAEPVLSGAGVTADFGPRLSFQTAWGANAVSVARACGVPCVHRIERFRRYRIHAAVSEDQMREFAGDVHDRMTEMEYNSGVHALDESQGSAKMTAEVDVLRGGEEALRKESERLGLGFDAQDMRYYVKLFRDEMKRNATDVELFDLAQSNSEHSRHWFFNAKLIIDDEQVPCTLMDVVRAPLRQDIANSVIAFADNSSSIRGAHAIVLRPAAVTHPAPLRCTNVDLDVLCTAETHNFPCAVAPRPGAETGTGGRIRDSAATGTGSLVGAAMAGYAVGALHAPGMPVVKEEMYPPALALPVDILREASDGASDYGNKFGEPLVAGFARSYAMRTADGERREYVKPIMFSAGVGYMDHGHIRKGYADEGLAVVKIGGPAYRIGLGGGAASSVTQGDNRAELDFNAVQRGDAQMQQKAYRVIRACVEMGEANPIVSLHDQGAGGNCNVVKELIYPEGARIDLREIWIGDMSLSALEIWGAEYQEQFGLLLRPESKSVFAHICEREGTVATEIGRIDGSKRIVLWDEMQHRAVVDMDLEKVLGKLPQKTFIDKRRIPALRPLHLIHGVEHSLRLVMSLMGVGSKRFLTTKVDRSVTGLVAQQQTVGALQLPLADAAVIAKSYFAIDGCATAIGERPTLTALSPQAMARMSVAEMLTNIACVKLTARSDIKCEANWMWAAKLSGDGASLYDAAVAMRDIMLETGIAVDGGKDSLSMAAKCPAVDGEELVRAPGTLVVSGYCTVDDINKKITPDFKRPGRSSILHVDIADGKRRLGGSALAQVFAQLGDTPPDVDHPQTLNNAFDVLQTLVGEEDTKLLAYHDVSDGGLLVAALEMAFAGNCGVDLRFDSVALGTDRMAALFAEEAGVLLEVDADNANHVLQTFTNAGVRCEVLGETRSDQCVNVSDSGTKVLTGDVTDLRSAWEKTSFALDRLQANAACVDKEEAGLASRTGLTFNVPYTVSATPAHIMNASRKPSVAIVREEGSNGDREMAAAFHMAGFEAWDVSMNDIRKGRVTLDGFRGLAFVGGFSYADVLGSAKGWAGVVRFSERAQFDAFYKRTDTFSLGVCNGCQLMALLGHVPGALRSETAQPRFVGNASSRYESRFVGVKIEESNSIMLQGMQGARLGVWVAHGEGRAFFPDTQVLDNVLGNGLAPIRYVDDSGDIAGEDAYPFNPNGSTHGIAALCSPDGRHLAMMPHPERSVLPWQWAVPCPQDVAPWLQMFQNARHWCEHTGRLE